MNGERDYIPPILALIGLLFVGYALKLTLEETSGTTFYIFLVVQAAILIYLLFTLGSKLLEVWTEYRWSPDRLK
jgi:hypothetical protein